LNEGKKSIIINKDNKNTFESIISNSDVILNSQSFMDELGINQDRMRLLNSKLIIMNFERKRNYQMNLLNKENKISSVNTFVQLSNALKNRKENNKGLILEGNNIFGINDVFQKEKDNYLKLSIVTKNYQFFILETSKKNLNISLKSTCERLFIEVLNNKKLNIYERLELTKDYTNNFELISKSIDNISMYIKKLCKFLNDEEIIKSLSKFNNEIVLTKLSQFEDITKFIKSSNFNKKFSPRNISNMKLNNQDTFKNLEKFNISNNEIRDYLQTPNGKSNFSAKF
jgi:hypothetical protein